MRREAVLVTGMGVLSPVGGAVGPFWEALVAGRSGLGAPDFDVRGLPCGGSAGLLRSPEQDAVDQVQRELRCARPEAMMELVARQALTSARLEHTSETLAVVTSGTAGCWFGGSSREHDLLAEHERRCTASVGEDPAARASYYRAHAPPLPHGVSRFYARAAGLAGDCVALSIDATCATGLRVVGEAARLLRLGRASCALVVVGCARLTPQLWGTYAQMMALSRWRGPPELACRPFDRQRSGMVPAEGAAALILETRAHAEARGALPLARVLGCAFASQAGHPTNPDGAAMQRVMVNAIQRSELAPRDVDVVNCHGTSTKLNDLRESQALRATFGAHTDALRISACKAVLGHSSTAAGLVELIAAIMTLRHGVVPPIPTCTDPDPECALPTSTQAIRHEAQVVLKTAFGFGGHYGAVVVARA